MDYLKKYIREIPDFPIEGILFYDITTLLESPAVFDEITSDFCERYAARKIDKIVAMESRGFIFATPVAVALGLSFVPLRKPGKLPYKTKSVSYDLEYGKATIEVHEDAIKPGDKVLILDDLLATGGTAAAAVELIQQMGGEVIEAGFVIELAGLKGRDKLGGVPVYSMVSYDD